MKKLLLALLLAFAQIASAAPTTTAASDPFAGGCVAGSACTGTTITATTAFYSGVSGISGYNTPSTQTGLIFNLDTNGLYLRPTGAIYWSPNNPLSGTPDLYISRYAPAQLMISGDGIGTSGTNIGWVLGNTASGIAKIWSSSGTSASYALMQYNSGQTFLNSGGGTGLILSVGGTTIAQVGPTAGQGLTITAGTATTAVNALSITQTWGSAVASPTAVLLNVTNTSSSGTPLLMDLQVGGTSSFKVGLTALTFGSAIVTPASTGTRYLCISTAGVVTSSASACSGT